MKRCIGYEDGKPVFAQIFWADHQPGCAKCRSVDISHSTTFVSACVEGSQLLMEELVKRQAPTVKQKQKEVKEWAKAAGVFKMR